MTEGERAQERPERRRCPNPLEQSGHRAVPRQVHVIDRVRAGDHPAGQRGDLQLRPGAAGLADLDVLRDEILQHGPLSELEDRRETGARHQVGSSKAAV